jgi:hypothetical protein
MNKIAEKTLKELADDTKQYAKELEKQRTFRNRMIVVLREIRDDYANSNSNWSITSLLSHIKDTYGLNIPMREGQVDVDAAVIVNEHKYFLFKIKYGI